VSSDPVVVEARMPRRSLRTFSWRVFTL